MNLKNLIGKIGTKVALVGALMGCSEPFEYNGNIISTENFHGKSAISFFNTPYRDTITDEDGDGEADTYHSIIVLGLPPIFFGTTTKMRLTEQEKKLFKEVKALNSEEINDRRESFRRKSLSPLQKELLRLQYQENHQKIFGLNGYADTNGNKTINFDERVNAYRKMGFFENEVPIAGETEFSKPTSNQLERAVKSYENK